MAFRRPLYLFNNNLREMSDSMIGDIRTRMYWLYISDPSVILSVVGSGGNLGDIVDSRLQAGAGSTNVSSFPTEATTAEPSVVQVTYSRINQNIASLLQPSDTDSKRFPAYFATPGNVKSMTLQDMYDTFSANTTDLLIAGGAVYTIAASSSFSNYSIVSSTQVYKDTRADTSLYSASEIYETLDQPTDINNYYLFKRNTESTSYTPPVKIHTNNNFYQESEANFNSLLLDTIRYSATSISGSRIRYSYNGLGSTCGTVMTDTRLDGSGDYQTRFVNGDDYRAQEFPNGSSSVINSYSLRVRKE